MPSWICKLSFTTPVRFGSDDGGSLLTNARVCAHSDTLFSALYIALRPNGEADDLLETVRSGRLAFSDTFPYAGDILYLPRPMGYYGDPNRYVDPSKRKLLKKLLYIPSGQLAAYMNGSFDIDKPVDNFAVPFEYEHVNLRDFDDPRPYGVAAYRFKPHCGLYVILTAQTQDSLALFKRGMTLLSTSGIGAKVSSGWGKFCFSMAEVPPDMAAVLENDASSLQLLLSCALPTVDEMEHALAGARYMLLRRGGFNSGISGPVFKRRTLYVMAPGSVFTGRFKGQVIDAAEHTAHPVWRNAMAFFMGVGK